MLTRLFLSPSRICNCSQTTHTYWIFPVQRLGIVAGQKRSNGEDIAGNVGHSKSIDRSTGPSAVVCSWPAHMHPAMRCSCWREITRTSDIFFCMHEESTNKRTKG